MKVITLQNGSSLNEKQFIKYFESKVLYTIRKFNLLKEVRNKLKFPLHVKELFSLEKIEKIKISKECLDDISVQIFSSLMKSSGTKNLKDLLPITSKVIRPFYLMSRQEMIIYSKLKKLEYKDHEKSKLSDFLDELEKNQKNIKNSIVSSLLKIENLI